MIRTISEFQATQLSSYSGSFPMDNRPFSYPVYLEFSHPVAEGAEEADYVVTLDGERIEPTRTEHLYRSMGFSIANARPGQIVAVTVPPAVTDIHGRELGREAHLQYTIPRPDPRIEFPSSGQDVRHLEAEFDPAIVFNMRNIVDFRLGIDAASRFFGEPSFPSPTEFDTSMHTPDYVSFHEIDLIPYLNDQRRGTVLFSWRAEKDPELVSNERYSTESDTVAVQVTDFGISTRFAYNKVLVWVNRLSDGSPVAEAEVTAFNLRGTELSGITDADGLAVLPIPDNRFAASFYTTYNTYEDDLHIRARKDGDTAELRVHPTQSPYRFGVYSNQSPTSALVERNRVHLFTDRGLYQPGEEFAFRGIHWLQNANGFVPFRGTYTASIESVQEGREVWRDTGRASESGGFSGILRLPDDLEIGNYVLRYRYGSGSGGYTDVSFRVGSFRRLAFEVTSRTDADHILAGESASVGITASYLAGGAAAGADYDSFWSRKPVRYVPPGSEWEDWIVGTNEWGSVRRLSSGEGTLSGAGTASVSVSTAEHELEAKTYRYTLEVRVEDVDRQEVAHATSVLVHPADHYVAARFVQGSSDGWWSRFVPTGDEIGAEARLVGIEGDPVDLDGVIRYGLVKGEWRSAQQQGLYGRLNRRWEYVEETLYEEEGRVNDGSFRYSFSVDDPGRYTLFFVSTDEMGRETRTEIPFYATGSGWVQTASQTPQDIDMVVDKSVYEPGETARILVQSPLPEGRYLLTIEREGIISERVVELSGSNEVIEVPVRDEYVPIFYVALTSYTERTETEDDYFEPDLGKPRGLFGITSVSVATTPVELNVELTTDSESYGPGDEGDVAVRVTHNGRPVANAEVTVLGVDRGVLDLIDYHVPNPLNYFYRETHFPLGVQGDDSRRLLLRPVTYDISTLQGGDAGKLDERKDFSPLALFEPAVATDADGYARLTFDYPDNLTTYRFTAIALSGNRLGLEEHEVIVQNPINVRTALPRRFRNRDTAAAGVVLTNTTGVEQEVSVTAESDVLAIADEPTKSITIPPNSVYELPFVLEALEPGEGVVRFTTRSAVLNEVLEEEVTVERPLVTEVFSTTGIVENVEEGADGHAVEGFVIPSAIVQSYGSLTVGLDTSIRAYMMPSVERLEAPVGSAWSDVQALYDLS
ncbi:MAG: alpha-2-macroglobulin family protein, partial [Spirochaetota bacterium]